MSIVSLASKTLSRTFTTASNGTLRVLANTFTAFNSETETDDELTRYSIMHVCGDLRKEEEAHYDSLKSQHAKEIKKLTDDVDDELTRYAIMHVRGDLRKEEEAHCDSLKKDDR